MKENPIDCGYLKIPIHLSDAHYNNCVFIDIIVWRDLLRSISYIQKHLC